jgi:tetratricopeptide (TPR) repeat protein
MLGRFDEAWGLALPAAERARGLGGLEAGDAQVALLAVHAGDHELAARHLRDVCRSFEREGWQADLSTFAPLLGRSLCALGRFDEAEPLAALGRQMGTEGDVVTQMLWRQVAGLVSAHRHEHAEGERLTREAVEIAGRTDALIFQGDALCDLAEVLAAAGRTDEAADALEQALERYERKKNVAMVAQVRPRLESLLQLD